MLRSMSYSADKQTHVTYLCKTLQWDTNFEGYWRVWRKFRIKKRDREETDGGVERSHLIAVREQRGVTYHRWQKGRQRLLSTGVRQESQNVNDQRTKKGTGPKRSSNSDSGGDSSGDTRETTWLEKKRICRRKLEKFRVKGVSSMVTYFNGTHIK